MQSRRAAIELTNFLSLRGLKGIGRPHPICTVLSGDVRIDKKPSAFTYLNPDKLVEYIINRDIKRDQDKLKAVAAILVDYSKEYAF